MKYLKVVVKKIQTKNKKTLENIYKNTKPDKVYNKVIFVQ